MNVKELLLVVGLALVTTWGIEYLFLGKYRAQTEQTAQSGQSFVAPVVGQNVKPLKTEIDFIDAFSLVLSCPLSAIHSSKRWWKLIIIVILLLQDFLLLLQR